MRVPTSSPNAPVSKRQAELLKGGEAAEEYKAQHELSETAAWPIDAQGTETSPFQAEQKP